MTWRNGHRSKKFDVGVSSRRFPVIFLASIMAALFTLPATAWAYSREGFAQDSRDQPLNVSGPNRADLESFFVTYDSAGSLTVIWKFYEPIPSDEGFLSFSAIVGSRKLLGSPKTCEGVSSSTQGDLSIRGAYGLSFESPKLPRATASVSGYDGRLSSTGSMTPDRREITITFADPVLVNRDYRCADASGGEDNGDSLDGGALYFAGFRPPECSDEEDNDADGRTDIGFDVDFDGDIDNGDPGCRGDPRRDSEIDPTLPAMGKGLAVDVARNVIKRKFKGARSLKITCRLNGRIKAGCLVKWRLREMPYRGRITVTRGFNGAGKVVNYYCLTAYRYNRQGSRTEITRC